MINHPQQPSEYDAVLGGQSPVLEGAAVLGRQSPSLDGAAVLGGLEGVKLRLSNADSKVRIVALEQALNYGEQGLDVVIHSLQNEYPQIQIQAYLLLTSRTELKVKQALLKFNPQCLKLEPIEVVTVNSYGEIIQRQQHLARYFTEELSNGETLEMAAIPGGTFLMGSPESEEKRCENERPQHQVTIQPFFMSKYPITQAQWEVVIEEFPSVERSFFPRTSYWNTANEQVPVVGMSWYDAVEFCARLSRKTGKNYRLPSEAEWEYACRSGTTTPFHFGETIITIEERKYTDRPNPVGIFPPNAFGLYDMHGNINEWCADTWHDSYKQAPTDGKAWIDNNEKRVIRDGRRSSYMSCSAARGWIPSSHCHKYLGFRIVCDGVLPDQSQALESAAILGGIEGVRLMLGIPNPQTRITALEQALNYGEQGLDLVIQALNDEFTQVQVHAYSLLSSRTQARFKQAQIQVFPQLYTHLRDLLAAKKWKEADLETEQVILRISDRAWPRLGLRVKDINKFPCADLRIINQLWLEYSNGHFGFSVQKDIYESLNGTLEYNYEIWRAFSHSVGWRNADGSWRHNYDNVPRGIIFDLTAPKAHLPWHTFFRPESSYWGNREKVSEIVASLLLRPEL